MNPFTRLKCACVFTESAQRLEKLIDEMEVEKVPSVNRREKDLKTALDLLKKLHEEHVTTHNIQYAHSLVEFHKPHGGGGLVLKTSAYSAGELKRARNPVKPTTKKRKKKKNGEDEEDLGK